MEQSVGSFPGRPRWFIRWTSGMGAKGRLVTVRPSKRELRRPKTTESTTATTTPDLSLASESSCAASLRLVSTRSIFFARDEAEGCTEEEPAAREEEEEEPAPDFMVSSGRADTKFLHARGRSLPTWQIYLVDLESC